jgi:hypothetical protein
MFVLVSDHLALLDYAFVSLPPIFFGNQPCSFLVLPVYTLGLVVPLRLRLRLPSGVLCLLMRQPLTGCL